MDAKKSRIEQKKVEVIMNKNIKFLGLATLLLSIPFFIYTSKSDSKNSYLDEAPGWFKHYVELKGDQDGNIPKGSLAKWAKEDAELRLLSKKSEENITNVKEIGPNNVGGRTRTIIMDHSNPNRYISAGVSGGIWTSEDRGQSWNNINDFGLTLSATSIVQSPFDKDVFYYGTGEPAGNSATLGGIGVYKSVDGAKSFQHLENTMTDALNEIWDVEHSKVYDNTVYVGTDGGGLWRSQNGGDSFTRVYPGGSAINEIITYDDSTIMIAINGRGLVQIHERTLETVSLNGGEWPTGSYGRTSFNYCRDYPDVMYAQVATRIGTDLEGVYKTSNRGITWTEVTYPDARYNQSWYDFKLSVAPSDSNFVISTAVTPTFSRNGGQTWLTTSMANPHADYHEITWENNNEFLIGNDGGIYRMNKLLMSTYTDLNRGLNITQYYAGGYYPDGSSFICGTQDNGTHLSFESSESFNRINGGDGSFCAVNQQDENVRYVSSQYLNITRQEAGQQNSRISSLVRAQVGGDDGVWFISPFEINMLDGDQIYIPTRSKSFKSLDGGFTWSDLTNNTFGEAYSIGISNDEDPTVYIGGTGSSLYRVDNAASSNAGDEVRLWEPGVVLPPTNFLGNTIACIEVDPNDASTIYVGLSNINNRSRVWRIRDADTEDPIYDELGQGLPESLPVNWVEVDPEMSEHIIIGTDFGLYTSLNGGASWQKEERIPNVPIQQVKLRSSDRKLFIFTHGRGVWTADLLDNPVASSKAKIENKTMVYPNPANQFARINGPFTLYTLFNTEGTVAQSGENNRINTSMLSPGTYFLQITNGDASSLEKLIVTH